MSHGVGCDAFWTPLLGAFGVLIGDHYDPRDEGYPMVWLVANGVYYAAAGNAALAGTAKLHFYDEESGADAGFVVDPVPGSAVFFPATMLHEVVAQTAAETNTSVAASAGDQRVSLSFNIVVRWPASPLEDAAFDGDVDGVQRALQHGHSGVDNVAGHLSLTAAHYAAESGHAAVLTALAAARADLEPASRGGHRPMHLAAFSGHASAVERLALLRADVASQGAYGTTAVHLAAANGDLTMLSSLVGLGASLRARRNDGEEPLHAAVRNGHGRTAEFLIQQGVPPATADAAGVQPLHEAARGGLKAIAKLLVGYRAEPGAIDNEGRSPLDSASLGGHVNLLGYLTGLDAAKWAMLGRLPEAVEPKASDSRRDAMANYMAAAMVGRGGDIQVRAGDSTPLHAAAGEGHLAVAEWLVAARIQPRATAKGSRAQPLHMATMRGHVGLVRWLLQARAGSRDTARGQLTPMHLAALGGHRDVVALLAAVRASVTASASDGGQPLHLAALRGHFATAKQLLVLRAPVNAKTRQGDEPLHRAAEAVASGATRIIEVLLSSRADLRAQNAAGSTPSEVASTAGNELVLALLRADASIRRARGQEL